MLLVRAGALVARPAHSLYAKGVTAPRTRKNPSPQHPRQGQDEGLLASAARRGTRRCTIRSGGSGELSRNR